VRVHAGTLRPRLLVDISCVASLQRLAVTPRGAEIGAAVTVARILDSPDIRRGYPLLAAALRSLGSVQIRNRATIGGNLANASPAADSAPALLAYGARLVLAAQDEERSVPVSQFLLGPGRTALRKGEYIRSIVLPPPRADESTFFHKVGRRRAMTIAIASLAGRLALQDGIVLEASLAAGSVAPVPVRLERTERLLLGRRLDAALAHDAAEAALGDIAPIDDVRASAAYRREVVGDLVARFLSTARA